MKFVINHGFILILLVILVVFIMTLASIKYGTNNLKMMNTFSGGLFFGMIFVAGIFMLNDNTIIEYKPHNKRNKWRIYSI